jgi:hypothetical protein
MSESEDKNPKPMLLELIQQTVEKQGRGRIIAPGSDDEKRLATTNFSDCFGVLEASLSIASGVLATFYFWNC